MPGGKISDRGEERLKPYKWVVSLLIDVDLFNHVDYISTIYFIYVDYVLECT